jgi:hypothetical protein
MVHHTNHCLAKRSSYSGQLFKLELIFKGHLKLPPSGSRTLSQWSPYTEIHGFRSLDLYDTTCPQLFSTTYTPSIPRGRVSIGTSPREEQQEGRPQHDFCVGVVGVLQLQQRYADGRELYGSFFTNISNKIDRANASVFRLGERNFQ